MSDFVAIDFETANTDKASACSIGVVQFNKTRINKKFESLIRPPKHIDHLRSDFYRIHGISRKSYIKSENFPLVWENSYRGFTGFEKTLILGLFWAL